MYSVSGFTGLGGHLYRRRVFSQEPPAGRRLPAWRCGDPGRGGGDARTLARRWSV